MRRVTKRSADSGLMRRPQAAWMLSVMFAIGGCGDRPDTAMDDGRNAVELPRPAAAARVAAEWPTIHGDVGAGRYSALATIHTDNVANLVPAWSYDFDVRPTGAINALPGPTPIVADGRMFLTASDHVVALAPETGRELWRYRLPRDLAAPYGLAYWHGRDGVEPRLYLATGERLIALLARSGRPARGFGSSGVVPLGATAAAITPLVFDAVVIIGTQDAGSGIRGYDADSGDRLWTFTTSASAPAGLTFSLDQDRALLFASFHVPWSRERDTLVRTLYPDAGALVALGALDGQQHWRFDAVRADIRAYGPPAAPTLVHAGTDAAAVPAVATVTASGLAYFLDRRSGEPVFAIDDRPVASIASMDTPSAPSQPFPTVTPPLVHMRPDAADPATAADTNQIHAARCAEVLATAADAIAVSPFTVLPVHEPDRSVPPTLLFPGVTGAVGPGGLAADPVLRYVFVNAGSVGTLGWFEPVFGGARQREAEVTRYRLRPAVDDPLGRFAASGLTDGGDEALWPCHAPPWGELIALNAASGGIAWRVPLGVTDMLEPGRQATGRPNAGGLLVTAGGLVFVGATDDRRLRAFASRTGAELWSTRLNDSAHALPITYLGADDRQYVAIVTTGWKSGEESAVRARLRVYALP